eukprot:300191_1
MKHGKISMDVIVAVNSDELDKDVISDGIIQELEVEYGDVDVTIEENGGHSNEESSDEFNIQEIIATNYGIVASGAAVLVIIVICAYYRRKVRSVKQQLEMVNAELESKGTATSGDIVADSVACDGNNNDKKVKQEQKDEAHIGVNGMAVREVQREDSDELNDSDDTRSVSNEALYLPMRTRTGTEGEGGITHEGIRDDKQGETGQCTTQGTTTGTGTTQGTTTETGQCTTQGTTTGTGTTQGTTTETGQCTTQ